MEQNEHKKVRRRRKPCSFCIDKAEAIDYKAIDRIKRFISDRGKIVPRRNSGVCARHQRMVATAIKRARFIGLIPHCID